MALVGACFAFLANALSTKGLTLSRNYFPRTVVTQTNAVISRATNTATATSLGQRLAAVGLKLVDQTFVAKAFEDSKQQQHSIIFIDARETRSYEQGHIPGAYQFDYYRPEPHLPVVLPAALVAESIIIYCNGGDCEDSEFAAVFLKNAGIPVEKLHVYGGGFEDWAKHNLPVEVGPRNSGVKK